MTDFRGDFVERGSDHSERTQIVRVTVTLNDLRRNRGRFQAEARAHLFFKFGAEMRESANGAGKFTHTHIFSGELEPLDVALHFGVPRSEEHTSELQSREN